MIYKVELARQAEKALDRLDRVTEKRLRDRLNELSLDLTTPDFQMMSSWKVVRDILKWETGGLSSE